MELAGQNHVNAGAIRVWQGLTDPATLRTCIPGCESFTGSIEDGFEAVVKQKVGPIPVTIRGRLDLSEVAPGQRCVVAAHGKGGLAGHAGGVAEVVLVEDGGTTVRWRLTAEVGGRIAKLAEGLIDAVATRMVDGFFDRFSDAIGAPRSP